MRLTKRHLKRIIREEYSKLKRRGLIKENRRTRRYGRRVLREQWMMNDGMGGPEDQEFPEGTPIEQAAQETLEYIISDYGEEVAGDIAGLARVGISFLAIGEGDEEENYAAAEALESMDYQGSGNYEINAAGKALQKAFTDWWNTKMNL